MTSNGKEKRKRLFLESLCEFGTIKAACRIIGMERRQYYKWIEQDPAFKIEVEDALADHADDLEEEAFRRGKEKSDMLLMFTLRKVKPEYRDSWRPDIGKAGDELQERDSARKLIKQRLLSLSERYTAKLEEGSNGSNGASGVSG